MPKLVKALLLRGESASLDYKKSVDGVSIDDFCAMANNPNGGTLLVGVSEGIDANGKQVGLPTGCSTDDSAKLLLINKAQSCHPPVFIEIHNETDDGLPFLRIEIPPSETRPHCTPKGAYLSRVGARNVAILPPALLKIFLEREAGVFQNRFSEAASLVINKIAKTEEILHEMQKDIEKRVESIADQLGWSDLELDETGDKIDRLEALIREVIRREVDTGARLRELLKTTSAIDPIRTRAMTAARQAMKKAILENQDIIKGATTGDKLEISTSGEIAEEISGADMQALFEEVFAETLFKNPEDKKN